MVMVEEEGEVKIVELGLLVRVEVEARRRMIWRRPEL